MDIEKEIRERICKALPGAIVEIEDESSHHAGHVGAQNGGHYIIRVTASQFADKSPIARQRIIHAAIADLFDGKVHALSMTCLLPDQS